jgi:peptidoglycan/xylan/chitin deacetylase (PgdA/CDA1 family)
MKIKIFLFHRINPHGDPIWPPITPSHFDRILTYLKANFEIVPLEETLLGNYKPNPLKKLCAITFDDGYKDFGEYALPIIKKHHAFASMYVITDCVNSNLPPWTYLFNYMLLNTNLSSLEINSVEIPAHLKKNKWGDIKERIACIKQFSPILKRISDEEKENIMRQVQAQIKDVESPTGLMLSWDDIRHLKNEGIEIGSHSGNHPALSKDLHLDSVRHELKRSGEEIEKETGKFPVAISYPFGIYNHEVKKIASEIGYKIGLTVFPKEYAVSEDKFEIPRIELYSEPFYKTRIRINGQFQALKNIFSQENSLNGDK